MSCRHQAREAEPKEYDIKDYEPQKRNLHNSTYHRIGNVTDGVSSKNIVFNFSELIHVCLLPPLDTQWPLEQYSLF